VFQTTVKRHEPKAVQAQPARLDQPSVPPVVHGLDVTSRAQQAAVRRRAWVGGGAVGVTFDLWHIVHYSRWCVFSARRSFLETSQAERSYGIDAISAKTDFFCAVIKTAHRCLRGKCRWLFTIAG
jgi:hypothetical protein